MSALGAAAASGGGFLLAVLWMDLIFDVQVLGHATAELPEPVLASVAGYYRRATTTARPMGHLIALVMLATLAAVAIRFLHHQVPDAASVASLALAGGPIGLALARTVRNAVRLGARTDPPLLQSALARSICRDHLLCLAGMALFVGLQLAIG